MNAVHLNFLLLAAVLLALPTSGALITKATRIFTVSDSQILSLTDVRVGLRLVGNPPGSGFAGEMFASLIWTPTGSPPNGSRPTSIL